MKPEEWKKRLENWLRQWRDVVPYRLSQLRSEPALMAQVDWIFNRKSAWGCCCGNAGILLPHQRTGPQVIVESFLIIVMDALDLVPVAPQCSRTDAFASNAVFHTKQIWRMHAFCLCRVAKFAAIAALHYLQYITQPVNCTLHKIHCCKINFSRFKKTYWQHV